jgi:hypothetical protein
MSVADIVDLDSGGPLLVVDWRPQVTAQHKEFKEEYGDFVIMVSAPAVANLRIQFNCLLLSSVTDSAARARQEPRIHGRKKYKIIRGV